VLQFVSGTQTAWDDLARRAQQACVVFRDCQLPPGCEPPRARIGFEIGRSGEAILFVDRDIEYRGHSSAVRAWLSAGKRRFSDIGQLREWIQGELGPLYRQEIDRPAAPVSRPPGDLTDLDAVTSTTMPHAAALLDEAELLRELKTRVYGQDSALEVTARRVSRHVGRSQPRKPATVFAVGPTGVGKTETAKALAESLGQLLNGRWSSLVRLNMNEYQERHRVSQLLGAPPSYVGYGDGTQLIEQLAAQPESVVLFDEIEKAHPDILVALMSAMDTGELSSPAPTARGRVIDCRRAIFFFTSNIDAASVIAALDAVDRPGESVDAACRRHLGASGIRPELVGRIGAFLVFRPLSDLARAEIATAALVRVASEYSLAVEMIDPEIVSSIVNRPYEGLGARPDEYYIDDMLGAEFARYAATAANRTIRLVATPQPACAPAW
jgi:ATP-dependent Clp protease ATP-binding subunit ClpA